MIVYKTTNLVNNKIYIGKDSNDNPSYLGSGLLIQRAIKKYGKENFKKDTLEICDLSNINEREIYWIDKFNSTNHDIGYNILKGGQGFLPGTLHPQYGKPKSFITRIRSSESHKGQFVSDETKQKMSNARSGYKCYLYGKTGNQHPRFGKHLTQEHKDKISKSRKKV